MRATLNERSWRRTLAVLTVLTIIVSGILIAYAVWTVLVPTLAIFLLMALPATSFCPAGWRHWLSRVPLSNWIMTWFVAVSGILTLIGILFRGPGWTWVWPWRQGIY